MSETTRKSLAQLKKEASINYEPNQFSIKQWLVTTNKLLEAGIDDESTYINNTKASSILLEKIPKHKDYNSEIIKSKSAISHEFIGLKNGLPRILERAEQAAKVLEKREEEYNKSIFASQEEKKDSNYQKNSNTSTASNDSFLQSGYTTSSGLPRSPVYIISNNMISDISSDNSSNSIYQMDSSIAERVMSLRNNGLNDDIYKNDKKGSKSLVDGNTSKLSMPIPIPTPPLPVNNDSSILPPPITTSSTGSNLQQVDPLANYKDTNLISAGDLFKFFNQTPQTPKILILDVRNRDEFDAGHIKADNTVCLEPLILKEGISTIDLENSRLILSPEHEQRLFKNRDKFDLVVYHDKDSTYNVSSEKFSSPSARNGRNDALSYLKSAIYVNDYKKNLKRLPVLLNGGFEAWKRIAGDKWIVKSKTSIQNDGATPRDKILSNNDKSKRNGLVIPNNDDPTSWVENVNNGSSGRAQYVTTIFELFQSPSVQSMTNTNYVDHSNNLQNYNQYPQPLSSSPPSIFSQTNSDGSKAKSTFGSGKLQRRRTIFDNPYYSFSKVDNPDYALPKPLKPNRPPAPKKPLPQVPEPTSKSQSTPPSLSNNDPTPILSGQMTMQQAPISDSSFSRLGSGIGSTGLKNLGNTCFMNSVIQCLSGTVPFARYFLDGSYKRHINKVNPLGTKGVLAEAFATLIKVLWDDTYNFVSPVTFKEAIGRFAPQFSGTEQQDSQEFLSFLLDGLHEDLNIIKEKPIIPELTPEEEERVEGLPPHIVSEMEWKKYLMRNSSVVVSLFQGQFRNVLRCLTCNKTSTTYNAFMCLTLPIPQNYNGERVDLHQCLNAFIKEEILDGDDAWNCPRCKCRRRATKQLTISRLPDVLLIHLKRFSFNGPFRDKLETMVYFPIRDFDLTSYIPLPIEQPSLIENKIQNDSLGTNNDVLKQYGPFIYDLFAVSNHYGGLNGGHYTACVRNGYRREWHNFDDSRVSACEEHNVMTRAAYNLFYVRARI